MRLSENLSYRKEDRLYQKYSKLDVDDRLYKITTDMMMSKKWQYHLGIGYYKQHYENGCTLTKYVVNILVYLGNGNRVEGAKLLRQRIIWMVNHIRAKYGYTDSEQISDTLYYRFFYKNYKGFVFEELLKEFMIHNNFTVIESKELDNHYKLDMIVRYKNDDIDIGIQCKSISYLNVSKKEKEKHLEKHKEAIYNSECYATMFIFHNDDLDVVDKNEDVLDVEQVLEMILEKINKFKNFNKKILIKSPNRYKY